MWRNVFNDVNPKEEPMSNVRDPNDNHPRDVNLPRNENPLANPNLLNNSQQNDTYPQAL
ncbi:44723_t:CDS:1, partial [Gigaspora margarita]